MKRKTNGGCFVKILTWVAGALVLIIVIGVIGGSVTDKGDTSSPTATPTTVASEAHGVTTTRVVSTDVPVKSNETIGQRNALNAAKSYLRFSAFSRQGLIAQLECEQYSHDDAIYAVDHCGADWYEQAVKSGKSYLGFSAFSYNGLIAQLEFDGFTHEQAVHGADRSGADWNEQAVKKAQSYLEFSSFSRQGLIDQLVFEGFTTEQAIYGVNGVGY